MNTQVNSLAAFYQAAILNQLPIALWQAPMTGEKQAIIDFEFTGQATKIDFERQSPGFAFSPFVNPNGQATLFLHASLHLRQNNCYHYTETAAPNFWATYHSLTHLPTFPLSWHTAAFHEAATYYQQSEFCHLVDQAIGYMQSTHLKKIIVSRAIQLGLSPSFNPFMAFEQLCAAYPRAFVSLVSIPHVGTWVGASPEILLTLDSTHLNTIALAGTQANRHIPVEKVVWREKEVTEQALVSEYIRDLLQQLHVKSFAEVGPETVAAGNVVHLRTLFTISRDSISGSLLQLGNQILDKLHPTSAVCGMPRQEALDFILGHEGYDRQFYTGFLGPVWLQGQSQLYVNLRCMQLQADHAVVYVGAGITVDSQPEAEWQETVLKSKTLLSVLPLEL